MSAFKPDHPGAIVRPSPNFGERKGGHSPRMIILHYTGMATGQAAEDWLCNPASEVSSHYLVHEDGAVVQMVRESDRAWHAGKSSWHGETDINSQSIGIEIVNPGHTLGYRAFPRRQIRAVVGLCEGLRQRHAIPADMVLAHSDIAPGRKIDPGEKFPWRMLAGYGLGVWLAPSRARSGQTSRPGDDGDPVAELQQHLVQVGYGLEITGRYDERTQAVVAAFQRHFRPSLVDGIADPATVATLHRLAAR